MAGLLGGLTRATTPGKTRSRDDATTPSSMPTTRDTPASRFNASSATSSSSPPAGAAAQQPLSSDFFSIPTHATTPAPLEPFSVDDTQLSTHAPHQAITYVGRPSPSDVDGRRAILPHAPPDALAAAYAPTLGRPAAPRGALQVHVGYDALAHPLAHTRPHPPPPPIPQPHAPLQAPVVPALNPVPLGLESTPSPGEMSSALAYQQPLPLGGESSDRGSAITPFNSQGSSQATPTATRHPTQRIPPPPNPDANEPPSYDAHGFATQTPPPPLPGAQPGRAVDGRFPRWRGWLEKRALDRHFARLDAAAAAEDAGVARKKSWGPSVGDVDALGGPRVEGQRRSKAPPPPPPLHVHTFGSRFLPHLTTQPLCAVFLDVPQPPPTAFPTLLPHRLRRRPSRRKRRVVLLVGTEEGLFAVETKPPGASPTQGTSHAVKPAAPGASLGDRSWNGDIRCCQVWSGLGVYQLAVLGSDPRDQSKAAAAGTSMPSFLAPWQAAPTSTGILLALCAPTPTRAGAGSRPSLARISSHTGSFLDHYDRLASHTTNGGGNSSGASAAAAAAGYHPHAAPPTVDFSASQWGPATGGGPGRVVPPAGSGSVRMWNLDELRAVVSYALDNEHSRPLDLLEGKRSGREKLAKLSGKLRKAWASLGEPSEARESRQKAGRRAASDLETAADRSRPPGPLNEWSGSYDGGVDASGRAAAARASLESVGSSRGSRDGEGERLCAPAPGSPGARDVVDPDEAAHQRALRGALNSVAIGSAGAAGPPSARTAGLSASPSFTSFFGDDNAIDAHAHARDASGEGGAARAGKGKERETAANNGGAGGSGGASGGGTGGHGAATKSGVLFFSVFEAGQGHKASGTWYLSLATTKSLLIYEALPPRRGSSRAWSFLKELWCPFPPKAASFCYCQSMAGVASRNLVGSGATPSSAAAAAAATSTFSTSAKLKVRDPSSPLSSKPVGVKRGVGSRHAKVASETSYSSILRPQYGDGEAAPPGWTGADLSIALSFGHRLVVIRVSDSNVRELELHADAVASLPTPSLPPTAAALPPPSLASASSTSPQARNAALAPASSTRRGGSGEGGGGESKQAWVGFSHVEARILVKQSYGTSPEEEEDGGGGADPAFGTQQSSRTEDVGHAAPAASPAGPTPTISRWGQADARAPHTMARQASGAMAVDKALPPAPAPQSLGFTPRQTQSAAGHLDASLLEDSDSSDDDDDYDLDDGSLSLHGRLYSVSLQDPGAAPSAVTGSASDPDLLARRRTPRRAPETAETARSVAGARTGAAAAAAAAARKLGLDGEGKVVTASLAVLTKGCVSHVLPSPLPPDLARPAPLATLRWSDVPTSVSAWARVVGLERGRSSGATAALGRRARTDGVGVGVGGDGSGPSSPTSWGVGGGGASSAVVLHVSLTAVALLASPQRRVEMRRTTVQVRAALPLVVARHTALSLVPLRAGDDGGEGSEDEDEDEEEEDERDDEEGGRGGGHDDGDDDEDGDEEDEAGGEASVRETLTRRATDKTESVELEYLSGCLVVTPPRGADAAIATSAGGAVVRPWAAAGDGGAWAFEWRNGADYRILYVGAEV